MKLQLQSPSLDAFHHLQAWCALVAPNQAPRFELFARKLQSNQSGLRSGSLHRLFPESFSSL